MAATLKTSENLSRVPVRSLSQEDRHKLAEQLTKASDGELVIEFEPGATVFDRKTDQPDDDSQNLQFHVDLPDGDWLIELPAETWVDGRDCNGNLATAVVELVKKIADAHRELAEIVEKRFEPFMGQDGETDRWGLTPAGTALTEGGQS